MQGVQSMKALRTHVAGVDVHKERLAITVMIGGGDEDPRVEQMECSTFTDDLIACGIVLKQKGVVDVAMESTGVYWKPVYNAWEPLGLKVIIGNASHIKNVPGRKTDMNDSHWIAQLHRFGLIRPSFVPEGEFQRMRLISRHRTNLTGDLVRVKNRVQRVLEDGNVKWGVIASDVFGVAGIGILELIAEGVTNAEVLSASIKTKVKRKEEAKKALTNTLTSDHCWLVKELMQQFNDLKMRILQADNELREKAQPYAHLIKELTRIPGIDVVLATGVIAESTADMSSFADERKYAAWAGVASGNNESAGVKKSPERGLATPH
jgi:transposase